MTDQAVISGKSLWSLRILAEFIFAIVGCYGSAAWSEIILKGLENEAETNVRLTLALTQEKCDAAKWRIQHEFNDAEQQIDLGLRALGYYHSTVQKSLTFKHDCWRAHFAVNPGAVTAISRRDIKLTGSAKYDEAFNRLLANSPLKPGSPIHHGNYESMKRKLQSLALNRGYLNAQFTEKKLLIDKRSHTAQIHWVFDSGQRFMFGDISINQDGLNDNFVQNYISIKPGDLYTSEDLAKTHNALAQSGYFETVDIRTETDQTQHDRIPVNITLTPKKRAHYGFGVGFDTDIGPLLNATYINRRINRHGHFFTANLDLSPVLSTAELEYFIPLTNPLTDFLTVGGGLKREETDTFKSMSATLSTRWKHAFAGGWKQTLFLDYTYEDFTADSNSGETFLLVPGGNWLISVSDNPIRPLNGYRVELEAKGSYENPISDVSFLQGYLSAIWLHDLPYGGRFIGRTLQGATLVDDITHLPTSYRFYGGGINSVRGYAYKELGPKNALGEVTGGKFLSVVSAEYEQKILDNWGVAAFIDTGNAFNLDSINFKTGVGLGLRWYSPVGPIRVDFAMPLNESDSSFQFHFAAGPRI